MSKIPTIGNTINLIKDNEYMLNVIASLSERIKKLEGDKKD